MPIRPTATPLRPPGPGPVVVLDARGREWSEVETALENRRAMVERLIVLTDQPVMHVARTTRGIIEYLPTCGDPDFAAKRFAEIARVYGVDRWESLSFLRHEPDTTGSAS